MAPENINRTELHRQYCAIVDELEELGEEQDSADYGTALHRLKALAEAGVLEAADGLAEALAADGPHHDAEGAYRWYYVSLAAEGYTTDFENQLQAGGAYCGPEGDFRNEAAVSSLIEELGLERIRELDVQAAAWIRTHRTFFTDPRDDRSTG